MFITSALFPHREVSTKKQGGTIFIIYYQILHYTQETYI